MFFNKTQKSTTIGSIVFLLLSFPFGLLYFILAVIGLSVGVSTIVIWIGLPILFATLVLIKGMAAVERSLVSGLLRIPFPYQRREPDQLRQVFLLRFGNLLRDPLTWTSTIYMLLKLPLGIVSFVLALTLPLVSVTITLLPLVYLVNLFVNAILLKNGIQSTGYIIPYFIEVHGQFDLVMFVRSFVGVPVGIISWFATRFLLNGLAQVSGELAYAMFGPNEVDASVQVDQPYMAPMAQENLHAYASRERNGVARRD